MSRITQLSRQSKTTSSVRSTSFPWFRRHLPVTVVYLHQECVGSVSAHPEEALNKWMKLYEYGKLNKLLLSSFRDDPRSPFPTFPAPSCGPLAFMVPHPTPALASTASALQLIPSWQHNPVPPPGNPSAWQYLKESCHQPCCSLCMLSLSVLLVLPYLFVQSGTHGPFEFWLSWASFQMQFFVIPLRYCCLIRYRCVPYQGALRRGTAAHIRSN